MQSFLEIILEQTTVADIKEDKQRASICHLITSRTEMFAKYKANIPCLHREMQYQQEAYGTPIIKRHNMIIYSMLYVTVVNTFSLSLCADIICIKWQTGWGRMVWDQKEIFGLEVGTAAAMWTENFQESCFRASCSKSALPSWLSHAYSFKHTCSAHDSQRLLFLWGNVKQNLGNCSINGTRVVNIVRP